MKALMKNFTLSRSILLLTTLLPGQILLAQPLTYENESSMVFTTKSGEQTDAFEGTVWVPENRSKINAKKIPIKYVRFPATGETKGSPIIYLSGGPGGSGINTAKRANSRFPLFMAMREFGDVIALDQRGTGASRTAPICQSKQIIPLTIPLSDKEVINRYKLAGKECLEFWQQKDVDPLGYTTLESVQDIDVLRQHFKAEKVTLWGISYGSHLALASLKALPGKIDKVVIASAEGLDQTVKLPLRTDKYFERLQVAIDSQPKAAARYPDIKKLMERVHTKLDAQPITLHIPTQDAVPINFLLQKRHMQMMASAMISDPQRGVGLLLATYDSVDKGGLSLVTKILTRGYFNDEHISFNVMNFAMDIASGISNERLKLVSEQIKTSLLGGYLNFPMPQLNKEIDGLDLGEAFRQFPQSNVPTLLLTGTLDGRTYIEGQRSAVRGLSNVTQVTIENAGHNLFMVSPKVTEVIQRFMRNQPVRLKTITIPLPDFLALPH